MGHVGLVAMLVGLIQPPPPGQATVRPGLEVLIDDSLHLVRGIRVGLVANHAAVDRRGTHAIDRLKDAGVTLVALMSPEHGFRGAAEPGEAVASSTDSRTGLPIYSLYGKNLAPPADLMAKLDVILVDLPDVGSRYFTYLSTVMEVMKVAATTQTKVIVLDRPNPIGGTVQGPGLDSAFATFVGRLRAPVRHGLSLGEQSMLANADERIGAQLSVVPAAGWQRSMDEYDTGLPFLPPSPNLKDQESLFHYPGSCLFEGTALSVGRGSEVPFSQIGAPWLDTAAVLAIVRRARLPGVRFEGTTFTPRKPGDGKFADTALVGIRLRLTDRRRYDPLRAAVALLAAIHRVHPDRIGFIPAHFDRLAGSGRLRAALVAGRTPRAIVASWQPEIRRYLARRRPFLLYR